MIDQTYQYLTLPACLFKLLLYLILYYAGCYRLLILFKIIFFSKYSFMNTFRVSNSLDPSQARQFVGRNLGPNCLHRFSTEDTGRQIVKTQQINSLQTHVHRHVHLYKNVINVNSKHAG